MTPFPFSRPSGGECVALSISARYLFRAGTEAATRLLGRARVDRETELLASLSDSLLRSAAPYDGFAEDQPDTTRATRRTPLPF